MTEAVKSDWEVFDAGHASGMARLRRIPLPMTEPVAYPDQFLDAIVRGGQEDSSDDVVPM